MPTGTRHHSVADTFEAPLVIIGVGGSLAVVGTVPVVITLSLGINTSATIIGVGFIGFGFLIIVPGMCWCLASHLYKYRFWRHASESRSRDQEEALVLSDLATAGDYGGTELLSTETAMDHQTTEERCAPIVITSTL